MKAAVLRKFGTPLAIEDWPEPILGTGEVVVDVVATRVLTYMGDVLSGARGYQLSLPMVPGVGAIGRVRAFGPDATHFKVGDWVYCDPTVRSRDDVLSPDIILQGLIAPGEGGLRLQKYYRDGSWAEQMRQPTENAIRIGEIDAADAPRWCAMGTLLVPYGGLLAAKLQAGETLVVNGATGSFGSAAVVVALSMGAGKVIATGRNREVLADLERRFGARVRAVAMEGNEESDRAKIIAAAAGPIDCVLDILPPMASTAQVRTAVLAVRQGGRVALMGGVGMAGGDDLALPYPWLMRNNITVLGQWMYPPHAVTMMVGLIRAGLIDLKHFDVTSFSLDQINEAVAHAAQHGGAFKGTAITF